MKNLFSIILIFCSIALIAKNKKKQKKQTVVATAVQHNHADTVVVSKPEKPDAVIGAKLFDFTVLTSKEKSFSSKDIPAQNNLILMLFNPGCGHCVATTNAFNYRIEEFKNTTILLVTGNNLYNSLKEFITEVRLKDDSPIIVASEMGDMTKKIFEYKGIPQVMIYNKNKILQQVFYKEIDVDSVMKYLDK